MPQVLANFTLLNDYLGFKDIDGVYWTLKAELKFYGCIFLLLAFGVLQKYHIWLSLWLAMTVMHTAFGQPFFMGWFITPAYSSFFIAGIAFFLVQTKGKNAFNLFVLISSLMVSSFRAYGQAEAFMIDPDVLEKSISVVIIWLFYCLMYILSVGKIHLKDRSIIFTIGALTYPLYLIHCVAGKAIIDQYTKVIPEKIIIIMVIFLMILVSYVIHLVIEKPLSKPLKNYLLFILERPKS